MRGVASFTGQSIDLDTSYLSCLENPTDACSIVCDAKEDVLRSYLSKDYLGFALAGV